MMVQCDRCRRHLLMAGPCPFCSGDAERRPRSRSVVLAAGIAAALAGCPAQPVYGAPSPEDAEVADMSADAGADMRADMPVIMPPYGIAPEPDQALPIDAGAMDAGVDATVDAAVDMQFDMPIAQPPYGIPPEPDAAPPDMGQPDAAVDALEPDMETPLPPYGIPPDEG